MHAIEIENPSPADETFVEAASQAAEGFGKNGKSADPLDERLHQGTGQVKNSDDVHFGSDYTDILLQRGYKPFPVNGKTPFSGFRWKNVNCTQEDIDLWKTQYPTACIALKDQPAIDGDIYDNAVADTIRDFMAIKFGIRGPILIRVGMSPKFLLPIRGNLNKKMVSSAYGNEEIGISRIEVLSTQQYWVAFGIHPGTHKPYHWEDKSIVNTSPEELPEFSEDDILEIFEQFHRTCELYGLPLYRKATPDQKISYSPPAARQDSGAMSAVDKFKMECDLPALIEEKGFRPSGTTGKTPYGISIHYTRPGKDSGPSVGLLLAVNGVYPPGLYVWSTAAGFPETEKFYNAFSVLGYLYHNDGEDGPDWSAAARDVRARGFQDDIDEEDFVELADNEDGDEATYHRLASLSPAEYDRVRKAESELLGIRVSTLDANVERYREEMAPDESENLFPDIEPWPESVDGSELLDNVRRTIHRYVTLPESSGIAIALWIVLTYVYNCFRILPLLAVSSPEKRCGKTTLLEVAISLAYRALSTSNCTPSVLFRIVGLYTPSLFIDEVDSFLKNNDETRGIINSGHTKPSAFVLRTNPDTLEPERFSTWCPKAVFGIGRIADTIEDRSIKVRIQRKLPGEKVEKIPLDLVERNDDLRRKLKRWTNDNFETLKSAEPENVPDVGNDRATDNWTPLLVIADTVGGEWPKLGRSAMEAIELKNRGDNASIGEKLLNDIRDIFDKHDDRNILSSTLVNKLVKMEGRPWGEWRRGRPLTTNSLSRLLSPFGINSRTVRVPSVPPEIDDDCPLGEAKSSDRGIGYVVAEFGPIFDRYLGPRNQK